MKLPVLSYTFLNTDDICSKQAFHRYVLKDFPFVGSKESKWGDVVHKGMEKRIQGTPLSAELARYEPFVAPLASAKAQAELKMGIRRDGSPTGFFDDDVWLRGKADAVVMQGGAAVLFDWKTGKRREDSKELEIQALMLGAVYPTLEKITGHYVWLADMQIGKAHDLSNTGETLELVQDQADEIEQRFKLGDWPAKQGPLCNWCSVRSCQFNPGRTK